jgi:hypothetical protein
VQCSKMLARLLLLLLRMMLAMLEQAGEKWRN